MPPFSRPADSNRRHYRRSSLRKNIFEGKKLASSFEILYGVSPSILDEYIVPNLPATVKEQSMHTAKQRLEKMIRVSSPQA
eukprot:IDg14278t1